MLISIAFVRLFFFILSILFLIAYKVVTAVEVTGSEILLGVILGSCLGFGLLGIDILFRRFNLRSFNVILLGLFFGYLMGSLLVLFFNTILSFSEIRASNQTLEVIRVAITLFGAYLGVIFTLRASDEIYVSLPFIKFTGASLKKKDLIIDASVLADGRIADVAASGLFDRSLIVPRFVVSELLTQVEVVDEVIKAKSKRSLEVLKKLENIQGLELSFNETDFPDLTDPAAKLLRLARLIDANLLTAELNRMQISNIEGVKVVNIHVLSNALKPLTQAGELLKVKIQRFGKEPRQGVGYLEDGTMVVINGGGDHIAESVIARVLSVKHTASGRMIFCNLLDDEVNQQELPLGQEAFAP